MDPLAWLLEPFAYEFMQRALVVAVTSGIVCGVLSCWLVLIGWSLMGDAVSHAVLPGVVIAYLLGTPFAVGALVFGILAVALIGVVRSTSRVKSDAVIGVVFTTLFALGLVLISVVPSQTDLGHILFGNLLGVSATDIVQVVGLGVVTLAIVLLKRRDLVLYAFFPGHAGALGLRPRRLGALLLGLLALTVVVAITALVAIAIACARHAPPRPCPLRLQLLRPGAAAVKRR